MKIESEITDEFDVVILCLKMDDKRFRRHDKDTFKILKESFGKKLWKNSVIALTFTNKVEDTYICRDGGRSCLNGLSPKTAQKWILREKRLGIF